MNMAKSAKTIFHKVQTQGQWRSASIDTGHWPRDLHQDVWRHHDASSLGQWARPQRYRQVRAVTARPETTAPSRHQRRDRWGLSTRLSFSPSCCMRYLRDGVYQRGRYATSRSICTTCYLHIADDPTPSQLAADMDDNLFAMFCTNFSRTKLIIPTISELVVTVTRLTVKTDCNNFIPIDCHGCVFSTVFSKKNDDYDDDDNAVKSANVTKLSSIEASKNWMQPAPVTYLWKLLQKSTWPKTVAGSLRLSKPRWKLSVVE